MAKKKTDPADVVEAATSEPVSGPHIRAVSKLRAPRRAAKAPPGRRGPTLGGEAASVSLKAYAGPRRRVPGMSAFLRVTPDGRKTVEEWGALFDEFMNRPVEG